MSTEPEQPKSFDIFKFISFIAALLALIGFTIFINFLLKKVSVIDWQWIRLMDLFGSVEAIVFAAAGFIFGREVNRQRANSAEKDVKKKEEEVDTAKKKEELAKKKAVKNEKIAIQLKTAIDTYSANNRNSFESISQNLESIRNDDSLKSIVQESANSDFLVEYANQLFENELQSEWLTFDWEIQPANKIKSISIGGETYTRNKGTCTMLSTLNHSFIIEVFTVSGRDEWTFTTSHILNEDDDSMSQKGGSKKSTSARELIIME